jgi:hypothetical protein
MSDPYTTCSHCGVVEPNETLLRFKHAKCREKAKEAREQAAWAKYGGCTCMGQGECDFCKERG